MIPVSRRTLVNVFCIAALVPTIARAQVVGKVYRVGILTPNPASPVPGLFIAALRERGWVVGRNLAVETHDTKGDPERAESLAKDLAREPVDLIATNVTATAMAARRATSVVPIVMLTSSFPVEGGLANSLARPGGNVTGMTIYAGGLLFGKFVQLLRELVPTLRELGVLWGYAPPSYKPEQVAPATDELHRAAKALNINVRFWQTGTERDLEAALAAAAAAPLDALFVTGGIIQSVGDINAHYRWTTMSGRARVHLEPYVQSVGDINAHYRWTTMSGRARVHLEPYVQRGQGACQAIANDCEGPNGTPKIRAAPAVAPSNRRRRRRPPESGRSDLRRAGRGPHRGGRRRAIQ